MPGHVIYFNCNDSRLPVARYVSQDLTFFTIPSNGGPLSGLLRFLFASSSREKLGPVGTAGVGNVNGLGSMFVSGPADLPKPHSGKKLDGDGKRASETNRLGSAETGVSILLLLLKAAALFWAATAGGGGLANGLGGPVAPALRMAEADGDGGGSTTLDWVPSALIRAGVKGLVPAEDADSAVALPRSELSLGICTFSCGRLDGSWLLCD